MSPRKLSLLHDDVPVSQVFKVLFGREPAIDERTGRSVSIGAIYATLSPRYRLADQVPDREQAVAAGWDLVVVDEAHHLGWAPEQASPEYLLVEELARRTPGLLLLTATPTQLGLPGHFARLRLLDRDRYADFGRFQQEAEGYGAVAAVAGKIIEGKSLAARDQGALKRIFTRDAEGLARHLGDLENGRPGARDALLRALLDQHGTGRVMFRNTRAAMTGFPRRRLCPACLCRVQRQGGACCSC